MSPLGDEMRPRSPKRGTSETILGIIYNVTCTLYLSIIQPTIEISNMFWVNCPKG
jgi:hypothetical protein